MPATPAASKAGIRRPSPARTGTPTRGASPAKAGNTPAKSLKGGGSGTASGPKGGSAGLKKRPPTSAPKAGEFIAAKKFTGPRVGMVFTNGPHGQGYYMDHKHGGYASGPTAEQASSSSRENLDAADVFTTLPMAMQVAFEARDIAALDAALASLPPEEAEHHMDRCIKSGLWDPQGAGAGGGGGGETEPEQEQEPSPTGESEAPASNSAATSQANSPAPPDAAEEEANATAEAAALEARARLAAEAAAEGEGSGTATSTDLFERGPYRAGAGGPQADAPKHARAPIGGANGKRAAAEGKAGASASAAAKGGAAAARAAGRGGASGASGSSQQVEQLSQQLRVEQQARAALESELEKAQSQVQRLLSKLDDAEKFKSDEARAMTAARELQARLQEENAKLRQQLADAGQTVDVSDAAAPADAAAATSGGEAKLSSFDAPVAPNDKVEEISYPPASLDPDVVLESLPASMQAAFDALDVQALHAALASFPPAEASEYMRRCVASGLWDPNGAGGAADGA
jgi:hypothetical protein